MQVKQVEKYSDVIEGWDGEVLGYLNRFGALFRSDAPQDDVEGDLNAALAGIEGVASKIETTAGAVLAIPIVVPVHQAYLRIAAQIRTFVSSVRSMVAGDTQAGFAALSAWAGIQEELRATALLYKDMVAEATKGTSEAPDVPVE